MVPRTLASGNIGVKPGAVWNVDLEWLLISFPIRGPAQALRAHAPCSRCQTPGAVLAAPQLVGLEAVMAAGVRELPASAFGTKGPGD